MFDAKSLLEQILNGGGNRGPAPSAAGGGGGGLGDILGQVLGGGQQGRPGAGASQGPGSGGGDLADILGQILGGGQQGRPGAGVGSGSGAGNGAGGSGNPLEDLLRNVTAPGSSSRGNDVLPGPSDARVGHSDAPSSGGGGGGLADILEQLQKTLGGQAGGSGAPGSSGAGAGGGGLMDVLGQILGQATQGVKEGAARVDETTGIGSAARDAVTRGTGQSPDDILAKLKELVANNQLGAGAAAGTLGGLILGTQTGRGLAVGAAKIGALALIGGLAYKAFQNYQTGRPLITGPHPAEAAPHGSGFEPQALTNQSATAYIRAMIAAAAADGRIDAGEKEHIFGALRQGGLDREAEAFLQQELRNPASIDDLADAVSTPEEAAQVYTAARIAIDPDTSGENAFLTALARRLGIDRQFASMVDHEARTTNA